MQCFWLYLCSNSSDIDNWLNIAPETSGYWPIFCQDFVKIARICGTPMKVDTLDVLLFTKATCKVANPGNLDID